MFEIEQQTFTSLKTIYNNETYYLCDNITDGLKLVDESYKNLKEQNQDPSVWQEFLFSIIGPI